MATSKRISHAKKEPTNITEYLAKKNGLEKFSLFDGPKTSIEIEKQLAQSGDRVWLQNVAGSEYHIEPISIKGEDLGSEVRFALNEIKVFPKHRLSEERFMRALVSGKVKLVEENEISSIEKMIQQAVSDEEKGSYKNEALTGIHESGLPMNKKTAYRYIEDETDLNILEAWMQKDNRDNIIDRIEERIDDIESGNE